MDKKLQPKNNLVYVLEHDNAESKRLVEDKDRKKNWKRWGPYLSERQWGTVREDYSPDGSWWVWEILLIDYAIKSLVSLMGSGHC